MNYNTNMTDPKPEVNNPQSVEKHEAGNVPKEFRITIKDNRSGRVLADYITDIAIIGGVEKEGNRATTKLMWIGKPPQLQQMLGFVLKEVGTYLGKLYDKMESGQEKEVDPNAN